MAFAPLLAAALVGGLGYAMSRDGKETRMETPTAQTVNRPDAAPFPSTGVTRPGCGQVPDGVRGPHPPPCMARVCAGEFTSPVDTRVTGGNGDGFAAFKERNLELLTGRGPGKRESFAPSEAAGGGLFSPAMAIRAPPGVRSATPAMLHDRAQTLRGLQRTMRGLNTVAPAETQLQVAKMRDAPPATRLPLGPDLATRGKENKLNPGHQRGRVPEEVAFTYNRPRIRQEAPIPLRSGAGVAHEVAGSRAPGVGVRRAPQSGALQIRNTMRRLHATAPIGPRAWRSTPGAHRAW